MSSSRESFGYDQSATAEVFLDKILDDTSEKTIEKRKNEVGVEEALHRERLIQEASSRMRSRILFITQKKDVLEKDSLAQRTYANLQLVFDEVHIMVLGCRQGQCQTVRVASKVWAYPVPIKYPLFLVRTALRAAKSNFHFAEGFRPDIIVATDPFEAGFVGLRIAQKFDRVFQIHVLEDFFAPEFTERNEKNKKRMHLVKKTLGAVESVRTESEVIKKKIAAAYTNITDLAVLPRFFNIHEITKAISLSEKKRLFPQYSFVILYIGRLDANSTLFRTMDAARRLLQTPSIGLVVVGDGPRKEEFIERAKILQIEQQVIFKKDEGNIVDYMQAADVMVLSDISNESEEVVMKAAAAGLPMILARTPLRDDLFTDEQDAFLCDPEDTIGFSQKLTKFINTNSLRVQFAENARDVVLTRIEESPEMYQIAYRDSIEAVLNFQSEESEESANTSETLGTNEQSVVTDQSAEEVVDTSHKVIGGIDMKLPEA
tara:strand:- start:1185 stop:2648 length:1464 start_codon:yes stop_codon:yes gene_type:complete